MNDFQQQRDDAELVGYKLAYEAGIHWLDANVRALEALRTRSLALVSVVLIAGTFVANFASDSTKKDALGELGRTGVVLMIVGMAAVLAMSACVAWPAKLTWELGPLKIIKMHLDPFLNWPSARVYKAIATDLDGYAKKSRKVLRRRARLYSVGLIAAGTAVVGLGLLWADVNF